MSAEIDWDTYEPTAAVRKAAILLSSADAVDATCFGWVPQAREALAAALDVEEMARAIHDHECGCAYDGEHTYADLERRDALATALRTALLGADL